MSEQATITEPETTESAETAVEPASMGARIRSSLALAQTRIEAVEARARAQWGELPQQVRAAFDRLLGRVRETLDVPSRSEVSDLLSRIEEIDRRLADLASAQSKAARGDEIRRRAEGGSPKKTTANKVSRKSKSAKPKSN